MELSKRDELLFSDVHDIRTKEAIMKKWNIIRKYGGFILDLIEGGVALIFLVQHPSGGDTVHDLHVG